ncbi:MAG: TlpA family protein disulfide reductase [Elusimicrobia bacterium]|nr:TlpA family protein disulfide reductase [Candidatus Obscuribacterium magneticum]
MQKIIFILALLLVGCGSQGGVYEPAPKPPAKTPRRYKAPDFEVRDLEGKKVTLSMLKGKVVFLEFWATWCPPCILSAPKVEEMVQAYKGKKVEFLSLSVDTNETAVRRFVKRMELTSHVAMAADSYVQEKYGVQGIPAFFLIDKEGYIAGFWGGFHPSLPKVWRDELDRLLKK